jgi:hypothetical protein
MEYKLSNGKTLEILVDNHPENPRNWDNMGTMVCFHRRYDLGDEHNYDHNDYSGWGEMEGAIIKNEKTAVILPLYLYDHSGITISTSPFSCQWDSGQIGFIFISKEKLKKEYGVKRVTNDLIKKAEKCLLGEVETYDQYLTGEVYGYRVIDEEGNEVDSCWGYYGDEGIEAIKSQYEIIG